MFYEKYFNKIKIIFRLPLDNSTKVPITLHRQTDKI
jgi:hypothetical protein